MKFVSSCVEEFQLEFTYSNILHTANEMLERTTGEQDSSLEPEDLNKRLLKEPLLLLKAMISQRQYV